MGIDAAMMAFDDVRTACLNTYTASQSMRPADIIARRNAHDAAIAALRPAAEAALGAFNALSVAEQNQWLQVAYNRSLLARINRTIGG